MQKAGLQLMGVSFRTAPVAAREQLSYNPSEAVGLLQKAAASLSGLEASVLSTCNRTEFYLVTPADDLSLSRFLRVVCQDRPRAPILHSECHRYQLAGRDAVRHLFRVACGLDSAVLGDLQIVSQVKEALEIASTAGTLGRTLSRVLTDAARVGARARTETAISRGAASLGSALAELVARHYADSPPGRGLRIAVLGAGRIARDIGTHLAKRRCGDLVFLNRTLARAADLARHCGGQALPLEELESQLEKADVVIAATRASTPLIRRPLLDRLAASRPDRRPLIVDAGVPRNIEAGSGLCVWDIDAIREQRKAVLAKRRASVPAVEQIIEDQIALWERWEAGWDLEADLASLYQCAASRSHEAVRELFASGAVPNPQTAQRVIFRAIRRVLHEHTRKLRNTAYRVSPPAEGTRITSGSLPPVTQGV